MPGRALSFLGFGATIANLKFATAIYGRGLCETEHPITFVQSLSAMLTFVGIAIC